MGHNPTMKKYFPLRCAAITVCAAMTALSLGCARNIMVKQGDVQFRDRTDKIARSAGLYLADDQRNWVYSYRKLGMGYDFVLGQALEASAAQSLRQSFQDVVMLENPNGADSNVDRVLTLRFGPGTQFVFGPTTMSMNHAAVELSCEVRDKSGKVLWSGSSSGSAEGSAGMKGLVQGFMGSWLNQVYARIFNDALTDALEKLNDQILADGRARS